VRCIHRWSEKDLRLVGPLPAEIQTFTAYVAALATEPVNPECARAFLNFLAGPAARALLIAQDID
jgi:ABC-type molybdate transport system substrate-binding protein